MAYKISGNAIGYEFRKHQSGVSKSGKAWHSYKFESVADGSDVEFSTTDAELVASCENLRRGEVYNIPFVAVAGKDRSYVIMTDAPVYVGTVQ